MTRHDLTKTSQECLLWHKTILQTCDNWDTDYNSYNCDVYIGYFSFLYISGSVLFLPSALFSRWEKYWSGMSFFVFCIWVLYFVFDFFHLCRLLQCVFVLYFVFDFPLVFSVFRLGKYWSVPGNPPPWSTPKASPLSDLYYSRPTEIFHHSPPPAVCPVLIGLFRALFDLRAEIQNWQVWSSVGMRHKGESVVNPSQPGLPPLSPFPPFPSLPPSKIHQLTIDFFPYQSL